MARIEAPRGEAFYYVASDGNDTLLRVNIPTVVPMVKGRDFAGVPLMQAAVDPCYSCTDR